MHTLSSDNLKYNGNFAFGHQFFEDLLIPREFCMLSMQLYVCMHKVENNEQLGRTFPHPQ